MIEYYLEAYRGALQLVSEFELIGKRHRGDQIHPCLPVVNFEIEGIDVLIVPLFGDNERRRSALGKSSRQ
jgi:hypothetical protein